VECRLVVGDMFHCAILIGNDFNKDKVPRYDLKILLNFSAFNWLLSHNTMFHTKCIVVSSTRLRTKDHVNSYSGQTTQYNKMSLQERSFNSNTDTLSYHVSIVTDFMLLLQLHNRQRRMPRKLLMTNVK
jgi:D-alanyl-lipoteichoic acid acyltransferase DltB (MBOAT superfamily)